MRANAPQLPGGDGRSWNWLVHKLGQVFLLLQEFRVHLRSFLSLKIVSHVQVSCRKTLDWEVRSFWSQTVSNICPKVLQFNISIHGSVFIFRSVAWIAMNSVNLVTGYPASRGFLFPSLLTVVFTAPSFDFEAHARPKFPENQESNEWRGPSLKARLHMRFLMRFSLCYATFVASVNLLRF